MSGPAKFFFDFRLSLEQTVGSGDITTAAVDQYIWILDNDLPPNAIGLLAPEDDARVLTEGETAVFLLARDTTTSVLDVKDCYKHLGVLLGPNQEACLEKLTEEFRVITESSSSQPWKTE